MMKAPHPSTPPVRERGRVGAFGVGGEPRSVETLNGVVIKALYRQRKAEPKGGGVNEAGTAGRSEICSETAARE